MRVIRHAAILGVFALACIAIETNAADMACKGRTSREKKLINGAIEVLQGNWLTNMNSTLPSSNLYPHQWSWDSAFIAMGYMHYDILRAKEEMRSLFEAQWKNGLVPHIVFNSETSGSYFPGPAYWKTNTSPDAVHNPETSGIIQPPVHALAILKTYEVTGDREYLKEMFPKLKMWHDYLYRDRDPKKEHLAFVRHPWETGMDNTPAWDTAFNRIELKEGDVPPYKRADNKHNDVNAEDRPTDYYYDRYVYLMKIFYDNNYDEAKIAEVCPYLIQDVLFNSILSKAEEALGTIAEEIGESSDVFMERSKKTQDAIRRKMWDPKDSAFYDYDLHADEVIKKRIGGAIAGIYGTELSEKDLAGFLRVIDSPDFMGRNSNGEGYPLPTIMVTDDDYMPSNYWRGPVWINVNYMIIQGLLDHGTKESLATAKYMYGKTLELIERSGYFEYFSAVDASPHGGGDFSWTASLAIDMICNDEMRDMVGPFGQSAFGHFFYIGIFISLVIGCITLYILKRQKSNYTQKGSEYGLYPKPLMKLM